MKSHLALAVLLLASANGAFAATTVWSGTGKMFDANRQLVSTYTVNVEIDHVSSTEDTRKVEVRANNRVVYADTCSVIKGNGSWQTHCAHSNGGGYSFDFGLAQEYVTGDDGVAFATQIIKDSESSMRLMRTELRAGNATNFYVESLAKTER